MKIHHVGYLIKNMENTIEEMISWGGILIRESIYDHARQVDIAFVKNGEMLIELVCPRAESRDVGDSLKRLGNTPYHICYECDDIDAAIIRLQAEGCLLVKEPQSAVAIGGRRVAFLYSDNQGLFEILENGT